MQWKSCRPSGFDLSYSAIPANRGIAYTGGVERIVHKSKSFKEADAWDAAQHRAMSPNERMRAAKEIRDRVFPGPNPDIREWHRRKRNG
jgi:hypothetical protein